MKRVVLVLLAAALAAIALVRRRVPVYPDWEAWTLDREGLPVDPYLTSVMRTSEPCPCVDCNGGRIGPRYR